MRRIKMIIYYCCRALGFFKLSAVLMKGKLLILCYHGFELDDESRFRPKLFIGEDQFRYRLQLLSNHNMAVLPLSAALSAMYAGRLPARAVAITIDDGFRSVHSAAMPLLRAHDYPATAYISTYYVVKNTPIFRLAVQYLFWKTQMAEIDVDGLSWTDRSQTNLSDPKATTEIMEQCIAYGEAECTEPQRQQLLGELGSLLGVDFQEVVDSRKLSLMTAYELRELIANDIDVQLHTHRHRFPAHDSDSSKKEIRENRQKLEDICDGSYVHFCYPSGQWHEGQWPWLRDVGVESATTCDVGFNDIATPKYALKRFLDGDNISEIEFLAEISGFAEVIRTARTIGHRLIGRRL